MQISGAGGLGLLLLVVLAVVFGVDPTAVLQTGMTLRRRPRSNPEIRPHLRLIEPTQSVILLPRCSARPKGTPRENQPVRQQRSVGAV